jgi:Co/Zn/Cd efflux system component
MVAFGLWVLGSAVWRAVQGSAPDPAVMSGIGLLALAVNVGVAALLFSHRNGDSNRASIWLCSRNDAIGNLAVIAAAGGVFASGTHWPDLAVAAIIAALNVSAAAQVLRLARVELGSDPAARLAQAPR